MSEDMFFGADLTFASDAAISAAQHELASEGFNDHEDNLFDEIERDGRTLTIRWDGSAPSSCFDIMAAIVEVYARHAESGEAVALQVEAGIGEHFKAGDGDSDDDDDTEVEGDEVDALLERFRRSAAAP
jgi:hypothetical protein